MRDEKSNKNFDERLRQLFDALPGAAEKGGQAAVNQIAKEAAALLKGDGK